MGGVEAGFLSLLTPSVPSRGGESPRCGSGTGEWRPLASGEAAAIGNCYPTWSSLTLQGEDRVRRRDIVQGHTAIQYWYGLEPGY